MTVSSTVRPVWDYTAPATIWRIIPAGEEYIVGEVRDGDEKMVSFFSIRLTDGRRCWEGNATPEKWWAGIEAVHGRTLFLHEYPVPSMPDHRKIFAVDIPTGRLLWKNEDLAFAFALNGSVYGSRSFFDRRAFYGLDAATGEVGDEVPAEEIRRLMALSPGGWDPRVELPSGSGTVPPAAQRYSEVSSTLSPGESMRCGDVEVLTAYDRKAGREPGKSMREHLFVLGGDGGDVLYHDVVCDGLAVPVPGTFFRVGGRILYVKDRRVLRSVALTP